MVYDIGWRLMIEVANRAWEAARAGWRENVSTGSALSVDSLAAIGRLTRPIAPFNEPELMAPLLGLAGLLLSFILAGVAVSSLLSLLAATVALFLLLTRFFGVSIEITALGA